MFSFEDRLVYSSFTFSPFVVRLSIQFLCHRFLLGGWISSSMSRLFIGELSPNFWILQLLATYWLSFSIFLILKFGQWLVSTSQIQWVIKWRLQEIYSNIHKRQCGFIYYSVSRNLIKWTLSDSKIHEYGILICQNYLLWGWI